MLLLFLLGWASAQTFSVSPHTIDPQATEVHGPDLAWDAQSPANGLLLISVGGTGSAPTAFKKFDELAAALGFRVMAVDYPNDVISTVCRDDDKLSKDKLCFDHFRAGICLGKPPGVRAKVTPANSLQTRVENFALYLSRKNEAWKTFVPGGHLDWSKVVLVGHSQGAGHVAYLSKLHKVHAVLMFGGPQDSFAKGLAAWVNRPGLTPPEAYYGFVHANDFFDSDRQIAVEQKLMQDKFKPAEYSAPTCAGTHIFRTTRVLPGFANDTHGSLLQEGFREIWGCLLRSAGGRAGQ